MLNSLAYKNFHDVVKFCTDFLLQNNYDDQTVLGDLQSYLNGIEPSIAVMTSVEKRVNTMQTLLPEELFSSLNHTFYVLLKEFYINHKIISVLDGLLENPTRYVNNNDFYSIKNYLEGFLTGVGTSFFKNMLPLINSWYKAQIDNDIANYWTSYINDSNYSENEKVELIIKVAKSFFLENPSWMSE